MKYEITGTSRSSRNTSLPAGWVSLKTHDLIQTVDNARLAIKRMRDRNVEKIVAERQRLARRHNRNPLVFWPFKAEEDADRIRKDFLASAKGEDMDWIAFEHPMIRIEESCDRAMESAIRDDDTVRISERDWWNLDVFRSPSVEVKGWNFEIRPSRKHEHHDRLVPA